MEGGIIKTERKGSQISILRQSRIDNIHDDVEMVTEHTVSYEPIEALDEAEEEIIVQEFEEADYKHSPLELNSYCCNEYFNSFLTLFQHMEKAHYDVLRKTLGLRQPIVVQLLQEYEMNPDQDTEEYWIEEEVEYKVNSFLNR